MAVGRVKWFDAEKGIGFIQPEDGSKDVFVDLRVLKKVGLKALREGQRVQYQTAHASGGRITADQITIA